MPDPRHPERKCLAGTYDPAVIFITAKFRVRPEHADSSELGEMRVP
jgi:hypothetical protein